MALCWYFKSSVAEQIYAIDFDLIDSILIGLILQKAPKEN